MNLKVLADQYNFVSIFPELMLLLGMLLALVLSLFPKLSPKAWIFTSPFIALGLAFCVILFGSMLPTDSFYSFRGSFLLDSFGLFLKGLLFTVLLCLTLCSGTYLSNNNQIVSKGEFHFLMLGASLGTSFLLSTNDFILLFVALETMSLSSVALIGYLKGDALSGEASIKYLVNSAVASAFFLFALSLIYGITLGSTNFATLPTLMFGSFQVFSKIFPFVIFALALILMTVAIGFKLSLAPFHHWAPDVYNGASLPITAFLATISKIGAFAVFCRIGWTLFGTNPITFNIWNTLFALLAIVSMLVGNLVGARQVFRSEGSIKRLLAYSSIAQIGYIMTGAVLGPDWSLSQGLFYMLLYVLVNLAAFIGLIKFEEWLSLNGSGNINSDSLDALKGLYKHKPGLAVFLGICFANLASVLPSMLVAKFILLDASLKGGLGAFVPKEIMSQMQFSSTPFMVVPQVSILMAITLLVSSVIAIFYYFAIIKMMFVDEPGAELLNKTATSVPARGYNLITNLVCAALLLGSTLISLFPNFWAAKVSSSAAQSLIIASANDLSASLTGKRSEQPAETSSSNGASK